MNSGFQLVSACSVFLCIGTNYWLGLAISGGVDSMALAAMYAHTQSANDSLPIAHGFIVDHKVRPESTEEAEWVAEQLRSKREHTSSYKASLAY
jgi:tRNA(Ile)-lysidine synthase TilS/MesJ